VLFVRQLGMFVDELVNLECLVALPLDRREEVAVFHGDDATESGARRPEELVGRAPDKSVSRAA
jgi:hypothetical protein